MNAAVSNASSSNSTSANAADEEAAFARATEKLLNIGAVPVAHYLQEPIFITPPQPAHTTTSHPAQPGAPQDAAPETITRAVARLHQACQQAFSSTEALKFETEEDASGGGKRCTLTITRPNGVSRTYTSPLAFQRKYDAKAHVATVAIENGAIDFIISGEGKSTPEVMHAPPTAEESNSASTLMEMDESVKAIEQTCLDWTYGRIKPFWLIINESKFGRTQGCALRIRLGPRNSRVWSVGTVYNSPGEAKKACAEAAVADGVLDYIRSWSSNAPDMAVDEPGSELPKSTISLQQFFDSLPKPFPEQVAGQTAVDINGPAWLNTTIQSARGGKIVPNFIWTVDPKLGFHGCLLRLERPGEVKSYLVDARFSKRAEAKAAVCLLAMSEGVGDYIRGVAKAVEDRLPAPMRKYVAEVLTPTLNAEYRKAHGPGIQPQVEYDMDLDACGATMTIELCPSPTPEQVRKYTVPAEYRNRNDAKLAVIAHAVEQGAIEFLRFKGRPPPPGYIPYYAQQYENNYANRKRKNWDGGNGDYTGPNGGGGGWQNNKRPRFNGGGGGAGGGGYGNYNGAPGGGFVQQGNQQQYQRPGWNGQKKHQNWRSNAPGAGHFQPGPRNVGGPPLPMSAVPAPYPAGGGGAPMPPHHAPAPYPYAVGGMQPPQAPYYSVPQQQQPYPGVVQPQVYSQTTTCKSPRRPNISHQHIPLLRLLCRQPSRLSLPLNPLRLRLRYNLHLPRTPTPPKTMPPPPPPPPPASIPPGPPPSSAPAKDKGKPRPTPPASTPPAGPPGKGRQVIVEPGPKSNVAALYDHCRSAGMPDPQFHSEIVKGEKAGEPKHNVWVIIGKTKFELPVTFPSLSQGQEKVAKKVLDQLRQTKPAKASQLK
ncbi:hypothetical protein FKP32DRAFT_1606126 [Trametes sanguinea]|nr:hypothetical protein FKP32DRAFT_1606126 [Trametes sanguinea]